MQQYWHPNNVWYFSHFADVSRFLNAFFKSLHWPRFYLKVPSASLPALCSSHSQMWCHRHMFCVTLREWRKGQSEIWFKWLGSAVWNLIWVRFQTNYTTTSPCFLPSMLDKGNLIPIWICWKSDLGCQSKCKLSASLSPSSPFRLFFSFFFKISPVYLSATLFFTLFSLFLSPDTVSFCCCNTQTYDSVMRVGSQV